MGHVEPLQRYGLKLGKPLPLYEYTQVSIPAFVRVIAE